MSLYIPGIGQNNLENRKEDGLLSYMRYEMHTVQEALTYLNERANFSLPKPEPTQDSHEYPLTSQINENLNENINPLVPSTTNHLPSTEDIREVINREAK